MISKGNERFYEPKIFAQLGMMTKFLFKKQDCKLLSLIHPSVILINLIGNNVLHLHFSPPLYVVAFVSFLTSLLTVVTKGFIITTRQPERHQTMISSAISTFKNNGRRLWLAWLKNMYQPCIRMYDTVIPCCPLQ